MKKRKKKSSKKKISVRSENVEKALVDNSIAIQKVLTNLAVKFDNLSDRLQKLLDVFEISAKSLAEKDFKDFGKFDDKAVVEKLDSLLDQNKTIAKSLILIHEKNSQEMQPIMQVQPPILQRMPMPRPQQPQYSPDYNYGYPQPQRPMNEQSNPNFQQEMSPQQGFDTYTRSIASQEQQDSQRYKQIPRS